MTFTGTAIARSFLVLAANGDGSSGGTALLVHPGFKLIESGAVKSGRCILARVQREEQEFLIARYMPRPRETTALNSGLDSCRHYHGSDGSCSGTSTWWNGQERPRAEVLSSAHLKKKLFDSSGSTLAWSTPGGRRQMSWILTSRDFRSPKRAQIGLASIESIWRTAPSTSRRATSGGGQKLKEFSNRGRGYCRRRWTKSWPCPGSWFNSTRASKGAQVLPLIF